ncbi:Autophagy-related protein 11 [Sesamum angolense]|uniref:Autophagy-related protein 11 n=1 Tax=Sesamum angolense TaxID=2727404 RepID=A0AAE1WG86_9LAMI|nr:Autophagy-related protein 11 [Sesamum angolense]
MCSSSSEAVVQMGKLVVHIAENGRSYKLDCDECTLVEAVQKFLESDCGIPLHDQLLLCLDLKLEPQRPLSAYKLPSDEREVFLFNKARMRNNSPHPAPEQVEIVGIPDPPLPSSSNSPHPLDDASDPALKALPSYERQFRFHFHCGHAIYSRALAIFEMCERLFQEQKVQERALEIAGGNLDHFYKMIHQNYTDFMKCYLQQHRSHANLLLNFGRDKEKLRSIRILPSLQSANRKCLLDFVKEENLQKTWEDCGISHRQFENKVSEFKLEFADLKRNTEHLFSGKASFLIKDLETSIKDHQRVINELKSIKQALSSANENDDDSAAEFCEFVRILADKVAILSRQRAELLDRYSKAEATSEQLKKELEEKKELVNTLYLKHQLEKQANKEKISYGRLEVHEIGAFVLNSSGHYEAINRNCPYYYLSAESVALFADHLPTRPSYIVGQVVHIEHQIAKSPSDQDHVDILTSETGTSQLTLNPGSTSNPYGLPIGREYFVVTVAMLPDTTVHSPPS